MPRSCNGATQIFRRYFLKKIISNGERFGHKADYKPSDPQSRIVWHPVIDTQGGEEEDDELSPASEREAQAVIRIVRQAQAEDSKGTIAILVRARSHLEAWSRRCVPNNRPCPIRLWKSKRFPSANRYKICSV